MTNLSRCFLRSERGDSIERRGAFRDKLKKPPGREWKSFLANMRGSLTVEAMLTLPVMIMAIFLCVALVFTANSLITLDQAVADTARDMAELSYIINQARLFGMDIVKGNELVSSILKVISASGLPSHAQGRVLADYFLDGYLEESPEILSCVSWEIARLPYVSGDDSGRMGEGDLYDSDINTILKAGRVVADSLLSRSGRVFDDDDVVLVLTFKPAALNRYTSLLPRSWEISIMKRQRAWLTGRSLPPFRGLEQSAAVEEDGPLVYITKWGVKYHVAECRYLRLSQFPAYLNKLSNAYGACSVCKPPPRGSP